MQRILSNIDGYTRDQFNAKLPQFGTFALITNLQGQPLEDIYIKYKSRNAIEQMFEGVKTILKADVSYMQKEETLNGWMFINHVAMQWHYIIYNVPEGQKLLLKISVKKFITELKEHRDVLINHEWVEEAMIKSAKTMLNKINIFRKID